MIRRKQSPGIFRHGRKFVKMCTVSAQNALIRTRFVSGGDTLITREEMRQREKRIASTAYRLFIEKGIAPVTMTEIAKKSHVGENTLYRYYPSKIILIMDAKKRLWQEITQSLVDTVTSAPSFAQLTGIEQMSLLIDALRKLYLDFPGFARFSYEFKLFMLDKKIHISYAEDALLLHSFSDLAIGILRKGQQDSSITKKTSVRSLYHCLWGILRGYLEQMAFYDKIFTDENPFAVHFNIVKELVLNSLRPNGYLGEAP